MNIDVQVQMNGIIFPAHECTITVGTYGQLGKATFKTAMSLIGSNVNDSLAESTGGAFQQQSLQQTSVLGQGFKIPDDLQGGDIYTPLSITFNNTTVFGGSYFMGEFDLAADEMTIHARDFGAVLFDTKTSLALLSQQGYSNQSVSTLVKDMATQFGLTPDIQISNDPPVGNVTQTVVVMASAPIQIWNLIMLLARQVGANVYTTPDQKLVMRDIGVSNNNYSFDWWPAKNTTGINTRLDMEAVQIPVENVLIRHQPQRNKSFSVVVVSHHSRSTVTSYSEVFVAGQSYEVAKNRTVKAGNISGSAAGQVRSLLNSKGLGIPVYTFYDHQGLNRVQCDALAQGYANEIAKRLFVYDFSIDGNEFLNPLDSIMLVDNSPNNSAYGFSNRPLYITELTRHYSMPQDGGGITSGTGFVTHVKALTLPPPQGTNSASDLGELLG